MKQIMITFLVLSVSVGCFGQADDNTCGENTGKHGNLVAYLYELEQIKGTDNIQHEDVIYGYKIVIPLWWRIRETPNPSMFGGTFPEINGIENALLFKAFEKENYKDLKDFEGWVITDYKTGEFPKWSDQHQILLKKQIEDFSEMGNAYKVLIYRNRYLYHCCYIILETSKAYVWIDFTATENTYDANFKKLQELLQKFKIL